MFINLYRQFFIKGVGPTAAIMSGLFAISHKQWPLFSSNQNTYLLEAIAAAVGEPFASDWLANQTSNIPVFSWFAKASYEIYPNIFYIYHFVLAYVLIFSLYKISSYFQPKLKHQVPTVLFFTSITFLNYINIPILQGVAGQYILGNGFQPSAFGVFLLASVAFFLHEKYTLTILCCLISAYFHPTYVLQVGILVFTYQLILVGSKNYKLAINIGLLALLLIFPIVYFVLSTFGNSAPEMTSIAQRILVMERIPHHALPGEFLLNKLTAFCLVMIGLALLIGRDKSEFLKIISIPFCLSVIIVLTAFLTDSHFIMLLFGQRSSVWLVPISSAYIIARLCTEVEWDKLFRINKIYLLTTFIVFMAFLSTYEVFKKSANHFSHKSTQLFSALSQLNYRKGVLLVPLREEDIRLNALVPIFVDWKSHPYKAEEVIEWFDRANLARAFYQSESVIERLSAFNRIQAKENISYILSDINNPIDGCLSYIEVGFFIVYDVQNCNFE